MSQSRPYGIWAVPGIPGIRHVKMAGRSADAFQQTLFRRPNANVTHRPSLLLPTRHLILRGGKFGFRIVPAAPAKSRRALESTLILRGGMGGMVAVVAEVAVVVVVGDRTMRIVVGSLEGTKDAHTMTATEDKQEGTHGSGNENSSGRGNKTTDTNDTPLARRLPGALTARKSLRRQVREDQDTRRHMHARAKSAPRHPHPPAELRRGWNCVGRRVDRPGPAVIVAAAAASQS